LYSAAKQNREMDQQEPMGSRPRILYVINVDWFFLSHRLPIARAARDEGAEVLIAAADTGRGDEIRAEGFRFLPIPLSRSGTNLIAELRTLWCLVKIYREVKPDLLHHSTIKPVIYGSLAARMRGIRPVINTISGFGYSLSEGPHTHVLRPLSRTLYRLALRSSHTLTVFQNPDDRRDFVRLGLVRQDQTTLVRGSGVDCARFRATPQVEGDPSVIFGGRMLWDKGVGVFVEAARRLRAAYPGAKFVLVGAVDPANPTSVTSDQIRQWQAEGVIEWWGSRTDMPEILAGAHIVALPSMYREGLPKVLLEAAASGRPVIATDVPGCREIVRHKVNGLLVPPGDIEALVQALHKLLASSDLRSRFGDAGRKIVEREFSQEIIVRQTLELYRRALGRADLGYSSR
jgi:glycosyltransferase involved in cell wall biosynthesis